jgi:hypothetical protein
MQLCLQQDKMQCYIGLTNLLMKENALFCSTAVCFGLNANHHQAVAQKISRELLKTLLCIPFTQKHITPKAQ